MPNQNLTDLTARTTTADTDLIHVNSGGTDYKETKANFLSDIKTTLTSVNNTVTSGTIGNQKLADDITSLNSSFANRYKTVLATVANPVSGASAGFAGNFAVPFTTPSGYTPIGIIGYSGNGTSGISYSDMYLSGSSVMIYYRNNNNSTSNITRFNVTVLCELTS